eukprot:TRINITY_DN738_c0_g1_i3.p1 TRINITY_DN738_c0_g1~~TRINITY_DN738_c0_g1_i3.p1  ORF type:complete len:303 (+),score=57.02 TRINITY_DN738_c0_g1_i3:44-910(+)
MAARQNSGPSFVTVAAAAAGACTLASTVGFAVGRGAIQQQSTTTSVGLRGAVRQGPVESNDAISTVLGLVGASTLAAAAMQAVSRRQRTAVKAALTPFERTAGPDCVEIIERRESNGFALGMVGSNYAGWDRYEFDPLCLSERWPEHLPWYREAELKHGRVAMLAYVGLIVPDMVRIPVEPLDNPALDFVNAHKMLIGPGLGEGPMWNLLLVSGILESIRFKQLGLAFEKLTIENAGDLGIKLFAPTTPEGWEQMRIKELKNGRLAMLAVSGALTQGVVWNAHHFPFS